MSRLTGSMIHLLNPDRLKWLVIVIAFAFLLVSVGIVLGEEKKVSDTKHDVAVPGSPVCVSCHIPVDPKGEALWAQEPNISGPFSGLRPFCFSCHDGTVTDTGSYVFDLNRPTHLSDTGLKNQDCDRCHNPHDEGYGKFLKLPDAANFCQNCHSRAGPMDHPINVDPQEMGIVPLDNHWDPEAGDFSGTRLWNLEGDAPGELMKCLTCHSPHGGEPDTEINTMTFESIRESALPLCQNCHFRGAGD